MAKISLENNGEKQDLVDSEKINYHKATQNLPQVVIDQFIVFIKMDNLGSSLSRHRHIPVTSSHDMFDSNTWETWKKCLI